MALKFYLPEFHASIVEATIEDIIKSLTHEFLKLSYIKEKKLKRAQCSIKGLEFCFIITFVLDIGSLFIPYNTAYEMCHVDKWFTHKIPKTGSTSLFSF